MAHAARRTQDQRIVEPSVLVRLKAHDPKKGLVLKQYTYKGIRFQAGRGWYKVSGELAAYLANVHSVPSDPDTPLAFDVRTPEEARAMDENDRKATRQVLPAEETLDVSHVRDEPPSVKSRRSTDRNDATRQQRQPVRSPENKQLDVAEDEGIEDEALRRRALRPRSQAVPRRRPRADEFKVADERDDEVFNDENAEFKGEAPRRRARRSRTGAVPHRRAARVVEDFDVLDDDESDEDELDGEEELQTEPSKARRRVEAKASRHGRGYDLDDDALVPRSRRHPEELDELDEFDDEDIENSPPPRRLTHRSHGSRARAANDYDRGDALDDEPLRRRHARQNRVHDELDDDHRQIQRVRGPRQAEARDALRNREARRTRRQNQYEEMPARRVHEDVVERELDDEPTQKLKRSRSQEDQQHELRARHARQMAAKLQEFDALDDAMSHGDAEDSLPAVATRNRHTSHGDAEDSLPTATRHRDAEDSLPITVMRNRQNGHRDAEDSLPGVRRMQHQDAPSLRHTADVQGHLDAVDQELNHRNVEGSAQLDTRGQRAQQPPSSAAHDELDALDDALDDRLQKASEDQRPGSARSDARVQRAQQPPSSTAHDELDALDDALDDRLTKASEDQRPGSAQPQHGQQRMGSSPQRHLENGHETASREDSRHEGLPWTDDDLLMNGDMRHQVPAPGREPAAVVAANPRSHRCTDTSMQNSHTRNRADMLARPAIRGSAEKLAQPRQRAPPHDRQPPQQLSLPREDQASPSSQDVLEGQGPQARSSRSQKTG